MSCDKSNCIHIGNTICWRCVEYEYYETKAQKKPMQKKNYNKSSKRMGSTFEMQNHIQNKAILKDAISSDMTPNSGAGKIKGDEQIRGLVNIMEELKTQEVTRARGHKQMTIKKEWLDKLDEEADGQEFWYLKFAFKDTDTNSYTVIDSEQLMSMIATLAHDRAIARDATNKIDIANKKSMLKEAESVKLFAETEYLKSILIANKIDF